eukprot:TRINITY_DN10682_c0_g2_i8.p1 TRINITY_DN10682_c0_g2~~TRINITY_DN10682_c0_g2_i8.p1  ORF type:complete len:265 (+),score=-27.64 TRINITY_DN10682_c0_g2_i8:465-1259(+)
MKFVYTDHQAILIRKHQIEIAQQGSQKSHILWGVNLHIPINSHFQQQSNNPKVQISKIEYIKITHCKYIYVSISVPPALCKITIINFLNLLVRQFYYVNPITHIILFSYACIQMLCLTCNQTIEQTKHIVQVNDQPYNFVQLKSSKNDLQEYLKYVFTTFLNKNNNRNLQNLVLVHYTILRQQLQVSESVHVAQAQLYQIIILKMKLKRICPTQLLYLMQQSTAKNVPHLHSIHPCEHQHLTALYIYMLNTCSLPQLAGKVTYA